MATPSPASDTTKQKAIMDFDNAKQQRKASRTSYTKTVNKLSDILVSDRPDVDDMEILLDQLSEKYKLLRSADEKFLELYQKKGCTQDEYDKEYEAAQEYYEKLSTFKIKCSRIRAKIENTSRSDLNSTTTSQPSPTAMMVSKQNLPEIRWRPKKLADLLDWI